MANVLRSTALSIVTPQARNMVRSIFAARPNPIAGLSTQDIYRAAHELFPDKTTPAGTPSDRSFSVKKGIEIERGIMPVRRKSAKRIKPLTPLPIPPHPDHAISSMRYLKKFVLEDMAASGEIEKVLVRRKDASRTKGSTSNYTLKAGTTVVDLPPTFQLEEKQAWLWRLRPKPDTDIDGEQPTVFQSNTSTQSPSGALSKQSEVVYEDESAEFTVLGKEGWNGKLRFNDVPDIRRNIRPTGTRQNSRGWERGR